jgi:hypothetical protein
VIALSITGLVFSHSGKIDLTSPERVVKKSPKKSEDCGTGQKEADNSRLNAYRAEASTLQARNKKTI